jgi:glycosyltransferase involved in cell wall biosynthesis
LHILHVTPHLPPDQAANALLPAHLGRWMREAGHEVSYVAHPPRAGRSDQAAGNVAWIPSMQGDGLARRLRLSAVGSARHIARVASPLVDRADLVHLHSNGLLTEVVSWLARRRGRPTLLTLYGTEVWHYRPKPLLDLFTRMYRGASHVTFYSRGLQDRAIELGLTRPAMSVVYPPVVDRFAPARPEERTALRRHLGVNRTHLLVNVKRLHPLAGQRHLVDAMPLVLRRHPDTELVICGTGALRDELAARARDAGVAGHVTLAGLVDNDRVADYNRAADVFVLPSLLEALPTVAVEALACGTPVVTADHPGGVELHALFGQDVRVVPREDSEALATMLIDVLGRKPRVRAESMATIEREFRPAAVRSRYAELYERLTGHRKAV